MGLNFKNSMRWLPAVIAGIAFVVWLVIPAKEEKKYYAPNIGNGRTTPTMATADVSTFISDSGYTKYHITAPQWLMYEDADEPFWRFPDGLLLDQYNSELQIESSVECDSALYLSRKRIWQLDGNVVMVNTAADTFLTQQLFWDQNNKKIYSDSFIHIVRTDRIIEGYGFESDQSMLYYTVNNPTAILPAENMRKPRATADSTKNSDTRAKTAAPSPAAATTAATPSRQELIEHELAEPKQHQQKLMRQGGPGKTLEPGNKLQKNTIK